MKKAIPSLLGAVLLLLPASALAQGTERLQPKADVEFLKKAALKVDHHIAAFYRRQSLPVPGVTDDATFMRRAFLVGIGRIPTAEEALAFIEIDDESKREELVGYLMESEGYSSHMTNWIFDQLRLRDGRLGSQSTNEPYRNWIRAAMDQNMAWDELTRRLIGSAGNGWHPDSAAVGYYTIDRGMPLDNLSNTMRVFLGSRMECAQCHDDPFGKTERKDFYQLAAFTHGQGRQNDRYMRSLWNEVREDRRDRDIEYRVAQLFWDRVYGMSLSGGGTGRISLPSDYQYRDGTPGEMVGARTPFGRSVRSSDRRDADDGREKFAEWIVNRTDGQFASVIANRMWKRVMGKGIYEPVDDFIENSKTHHPALLDDLAKLMVELEYDLRAFQQVLMLTRTFQFRTNPNQSIVDGGDDFHGRKIERLSAEQIWDSLITLSSGNPDAKPKRTIDDRIYVGNRPVLVGQMNMAQLSEEVLALESEREVRKYFDEFLEKVRSGGGKDQPSASMMGMTQVQRYNRDSPVRASELPSPAPRDHFLYMFGASDREVVDGASREPNVGQVLSMMNGYVQRRLVGNSEAHLYKSLDGTASEMEKIRRIYLAVLSRPPSEEEMSWMLEEIQSRGNEGHRNIVAALIMSSEFLFLQ